MCGLQHALRPAEIAPVAIIRAIGDDLFSLRGETMVAEMALTSVVLPTPGPPVMTRARLDRASLSASRWLGASTLPVFC